MWLAPYQGRSETDWSSMLILRKEITFESEHII